VQEIKSLEGVKLSVMDRWLLSRLGKTVKSVELAMDTYSFHLATAALKSFLYDDHCCIYLEASKAWRVSKDSKKCQSAAKVANAVLAVAVDYLEPFTPFFVSELKLHLPMDCKIDTESFIDEPIEEKVQILLEICESIRVMKAECRITKKIPSEIQILIKSPEHEEFLKSQAEVIKSLTFTDDLTLVTNAEQFEAEDFIALSTAGHLCSFGIRTMDKGSGKFENMVNQKKFSKLESELMNLMNAVNHVGYQKNANEKVKKKHKEKVS
jgi:valyl-tRNA synthetase